MVTGLSVAQVCEIINRYIALDCEEVADPIANELLMSPHHTWMMILKFYFKEDELQVALESIVDDLTRARSLNVRRDPKDEDRRKGDCTELTNTVGKWWRTTVQIEAERDRVAEELKLERQRVVDLENKYRNVISWIDSHRVGNSTNYLLIILVIFTHILSYYFQYRTS